MGWCLRGVSHDTFMPVIYCPPLQALLSEPLWGPAHSQAPCGKSSVIWHDGRGREWPTSCFISFAENVAPDFFNLHRCNIVRADKFLSVVFWFMPSWRRGCRGSSVSQSLCYNLKYLDTFWMDWMKFGLENLWLIIQLRCRLNLSHTLWDIVKYAWWIGTKLNADICGSQMIHLVTLAYTVCAM